MNICCKSCNSRKEVCKNLDDDYLHLDHKFMELIYQNHKSKKYGEEVYHSIMENFILTALHQPFNSKNIEYIKISINLLDTEIRYRHPHERYINFRKISKHAECIPSFFILHIITYYDAYFHIYETQEEAERNKESKMLEAEEKNMSGVEFVEISSSQSFLSKLTKVN